MSKTPLKHEVKSDAGSLGLALGFSFGVLLGVYTNDFSFLPLMVVLGYVLNLPAQKK